MPGPKASAAYLAVQCCFNTAHGCRLAIALRAHGVCFATSIPHSPYSTLAQYRDSDTHTSRVSSFPTATVQQGRRGTRDVAWTCRASLYSVCSTS
eukprot:1479004-Rhodomonas_salina.2